MLPIEYQTYVPALRLKEGEYLALAEIGSDVQDRLLPHFILPPPKERDPEKGRALWPDEVAHLAGRRIGRYWPLRPCLLDPRFLFSALGEDEGAAWLQTLFRIAWDSNCRAIPVLSLSDLEGARSSAVRSILNVQDVGLAFRLTLFDLLDPELGGRLHRALLSIVAKPQDCLIVLDLSDADASDPILLGDSMVAYFQQVLEYGLWSRVVLEATSYPESNPAPAGGEILVPRNEWNAWTHATGSDLAVRRELMFGDFAADSAKFQFAESGGPAIRHYRYSTPDKWFVLRGGKAEPTEQAMRTISKKLIDSALFAGRGFSRGDAAIFNCAMGIDGPGNASTWRKINTVHHLTRVVGDLGATYGYAIEARSLERLPLQHSLF